MLGHKCFTGCKSYRVNLESIDVIPVFSNAKVVECVRAFLVKRENTFHFCLLSLDCEDFRPSSGHDSAPGKSDEVVYQQKRAMFGSTQGRFLLTS